MSILLSEKKTKEKEKEKKKQEEKKKKSEQTGILSFPTRAAASHLKKVNRQGMNVSPYIRASHLWHEKAQYGAASDDTQSIFSYI